VTDLKGPGFSPGLFIWVRANYFGWMATETTSLEFLQRQQLELLKEMRAMREDLGQSFRLLTDTQISIGRTLSGLDRRLSEVKDDLETTLRMELVGHRNSTGDDIDRRADALRDELLTTLTQIFDERYAPKS